MPAPSNDDAGPDRPLHLLAGNHAGFLPREDGVMDREDLPKHILERVERRWAQKLQQQALAWKESRADKRSVTDTGVQVVRRARRSRRQVLRDAS